MDYNDLKKQEEAYWAGRRGKASSSYRHARAHHLGHLHGRIDRHVDKTAGIAVQGWSILFGLFVGALLIILIAPYIFVMVLGISLTWMISKIGFKNDSTQPRFKYLLKALWHSMLRSICLVAFINLIILPYFDMNTINSITLFAHIKILIVPWTAYDFRRFAEGTISIYRILIVIVLTTSIFIGLYYTVEPIGIAFYSYIGKEQRREAPALRFRNAVYLTFTPNGRWGHTGSLKYRKCAEGLAQNERGYIRLYRGGVNIICQEKKFRCENERPVYCFETRICPVWPQLEKLVRSIFQKAASILLFN